MNGVQKYDQSSRWTLPPTPRQISALVQLGVQVDDIPEFRWQARDMIYKLRQQREFKNASKE